MTNPTKLTKDQKLEALGCAFYDRLPWRPQAGDYYTTPRPDLELYQVVRVENGKVYTVYCNPDVWGGPEPQESEWSMEEFIGPEAFPRTWVPHEVLGLEPPNGEPMGFRVMREREEREGGRLRRCAAAIQFGPTRWAARTRRATAPPTKTTATPRSSTSYGAGWARQRTGSTAWRPASPS